jgi:RNA polymerase sigma-70 factor (sigma-E family)
MADDAGAAASAVRDPGSFLSAHLDSLVRTAFLLVGSHHGAEDLVMEAVSKCLPRWQTITGDPLPYVRKAVVHEYLSKLRRLRVVRETPTAELPESAVRDQQDRVVLRADLLAALTRLPRRQRAVVVLRYLDDLSTRQVAELLQITEGTVRSQTHDALTTLRSAAPETLRSYLTATAEHDEPATP